MSDRFPKKDEPWRRGGGERIRGFEDGKFSRAAVKDFITSSKFARTNPSPQGRTGCAAFAMHDDNEQDDDEGVASFSPKRKKKQTNSMLLDLDSAEQISPGFLSSLRYKTRSLTS